MTDDNPLASKSDAELAAMEQDRSLPIDQWMAVEAERGRRRKAQGARSGTASTIAKAGAIPAAATHGEDGNVVAGLAELEALLVPGERLQAHAVQRRIFALSHRRLIVGATTGRFIALSRGLIGGYTPWDMRWQDLRDVQIRAGVFGADLTITAMASDDLASHGPASGIRRTFLGLRKAQAQSVYKICQSQEQAWREKRRVRDLDELRAESGGVQLGGLGMASAGGAAAQAGADPTDRLRRAKDMLDSGLITDSEYESIKARIVDGL